MDPHSRVLGLLQERLRAAKTPGASLAAHRDAKPVLEAATGLQSLDPPASATPATIYRIASITKTFTAIAVLQLVEKGLLSLDDPADKYLPITLRVRDKPVTVEHLLSHTSGIPAPGYAEAQVAQAMGDPWAQPPPVGGAMDALLFLEKAASHADAEPGERFYYMNEGYIALGVIVERVSGRRYEEYVEENIARPLGLRSTTMSTERAAATGRLAKPYIVYQGEARPAPQPAWVWSDGGLYSTAPELARLYTALMRGGELDGERILEKTSVEEMEKPRARLPAQLWGSDSYGLGVTIYQGTPLGTLVGHSGALPGYTGYAFHARSHSLAAALLANGEPGAREAALTAAATLLGIDPAELPFNTLDAVLARLEGDYVNPSRTVAARLTRLGDYLLLESRSPPGLLRTVLVPRDLTDPGHPVFETSLRARKMTVEFEAVDDCTVKMRYDRYLLYKTQPCPR